MARLQQNRQKYEALGRSIAKYVSKIGLTPNQLTLLSLLAAVGAGITIAYQNLPLTLAGLVLVAVFDMLDGSVARATGQATQFGGLFDHVVDRYAEAVLLLGVMLSDLVAPALVLFALFGMVMASYTRARAESKPGMDNCNVGLAGRLEKLLILIAGLILELGGILSGTLVWSVILIGLMSHITVIQRLRYSYEVLSKYSE
ncbi:MAG: CDP-alcohol phosphatidyltransferase family protein [Anaerolineae bacterium]|nr:CDP-alcohol phosphatidyltransferase family protein [Anaerolineae bacterium]